MSKAPDLHAVKARISEIQNQIAALDDELEGLQIAEEVLEKLAVAPTSEGPKPLSANLTVNELILATLKRSRVAWLTVPQLQKLIEDMSGRKVPMGTLSPQVSWLTNSEKLIVRDGSHVALPERSKEKKPEDLPF